MGTIVSRRRKSGGIAYMARIILKRDRKVIHSESKTFSSHRVAKAWIQRRETELSEPGALEQKVEVSTLGDAIDRYTEETMKAIGRTKEQVLRSIRRDELAQRPCAEIRSADIIDLCRRLSAGRSPQTVANYMSHLSAIFAIARPAWGFELSHDEIKAALVVARKLGLTASSIQRDRRPTLDELDRVMQHFLDRCVRKPSAAPMHRIVAFAIFSTRRQEEIARIEWRDLDREHSRILVRDMKHPGEKIGNHQWVDLPPQALAIIEATPKTDARIFPYGTDAISAAFTRACQFLEIEDLTFHDLRHEGVSRLFEIGLNIPHVAAVSGHRSWQSLKRYTHIRHAGDKYAAWSWLDQVAPPATAE